MKLLKKKIVAVNKEDGTQEEFEINVKPECCEAAVSDTEGCCNFNLEEELPPQSRLLKNAELAEEKAKTFFKQTEEKGKDELKKLQDNLQEGVKIAQEKKQELEVKIKEGSEKAKKAVLGEDGKFNSEDLQRVVNGFVDIGAGALGLAEKGFAWARKKVETLKKEDKKEA